MATAEVSIGRVTATKKDANQNQFTEFYGYTETNFGASSSTDSGINDKLTDMGTGLAYIDSLSSAYLAPQYKITYSVSIG